MFGAASGHKTAQYHGSASRPAQWHGHLKEHLFAQIHHWIIALEAFTHEWSLEEDLFLSDYRAFYLKSHSCFSEVFGHLFG